MGPSQRSPIVRGKRRAAGLVAALLIFGTTFGITAPVSATYQAIELVSTGQDADDYAYFTAMTPDGSHLYYAWYTVTAGSNLGFDLYESFNGQRTLISTGPNDANDPTPTDPIFHAAATDGSRVLFATRQALVAADTDGGYVDVYERSGNTTTLISTSPTDTAAAEDAYMVAGSPDATQVVFATAARLVSQDTDDRNDLYLRVGTATTLLTIGTGGGNEAADVNYAGAVFVAACGCIHVFFNTTESLVAEDTDSQLDAYESSSGTTTLVSPDPTPDPDAHYAGFTAVSADGSIVLIDTNAPIDPADANTDTDLYAYQGGVPTLVSVGVNGQSAGYRTMSPDGSRIFFFTDAQLVPEDGDSYTDLYERSGGLTYLVSGGPGGVGNSLQDLSSSEVLFRGTSLYFGTNAPLDPLDTDTQPDVYEWTGGVASLVSASGGPATRLQMIAASQDGAFLITTTNGALSPQDTDEAEDIYRIATTPNATPELVSGKVGAGGPIGSYDGVSYGGSSADGSSVAIDTPESLVAADTDVPDHPEAADVYIWGPHPNILPAAPANVVATRGDREATVTWTAPFDGGSPITSYTVRSAPGGRTAIVNGSATTVVVTGLTNGKAYTFTVVATTAVGSSPPSAPSNSVTPVANLAQTITFASPGPRLIGQSPITVTATASSSLLVTLTSTTQPVCTVSGFTITFVQIGSCTIVASQTGDATYKPATNVSRTFTISKASQTITFVNPGARPISQSPLTVSATASSGLPVTLTSTTQAVCTVSGFTITFVQVGSCTIVASQAGNANVAAAPNVSRSFKISKASQTITLANPGPQSLLVPTVVASPWASSGLTVTLSSSTGPVCTVSGTTITLRKAGTCKISANQAGDAYYAAAPKLLQSFTVNAAPALPFVVANGTALTIGGQPFTIQGGSLYETSNHGATANPSQTIASAVAGGLNTIRLVNMFDETGTPAGAPFLEADWQRIDELIARARGANLRVVLDLSAYRNFLVNRDIAANGWTGACLPNADRSPVDYAVISPYRAALAGEWQTFLSFVANRVNTVTGVVYKNDASIAVVSVAGEPLPPESAECGKATTTNELTDFYATTLGYWRTLDANHLRSTGGLIHLDWVELYGNSSGIDGQAIFSLADNTLPALHTYPPQYATDGTPLDFQTPAMGPYATQLGKPWFTEEFGWTQSVGDATRAGYFQWLYSEQATYSSAGALFWNLGPEQAGGSHDVNSSTALTWAEVLRH